MTVFLRVLEAAVEEKPFELLSAIRRLREPSAEHAALAVFERDAAVFSAVPGSPFAYWVTDSLCNLFAVAAPLESPEDGRIARRGMGTNDDFRFLRLWTEVDASMWTLLGKGGTYSPYYGDLSVAVNWRSNGHELKAFFIGNDESPSRNIRSESEYLRPGLTWPLRTQSGLGVRVLPSGCIFGSKGPTAFVKGDSMERLLALLAVMTSVPFRYLVELQMAFGSYEVGVIQRTPVPHLSESDVAALARLSRRAWSLMRLLDTTNETSHAFILPSGPNEGVTGLDRCIVEQELESIKDKINETAFSLYGIASTDCAAIEDSSKSFALSDTSEDEETEDDRHDASEVVAPLELGTDVVSAWLVGVAFGRFDLRLATGERSPPPEPEPFDPLPSRSPGMWPEGAEPARRPDILVDDEGHPDDLVAEIRAVTERIGVGARGNLRAWLAKEFFPLHIKMYSRSRRKSPIYWQLATSSASYSVWLYIHAFTKDTLFRVQNDYAAPKLAHEERGLESLRRELGHGGTAAQRKELAAQEAFVEELRTFVEEVKRVAPLWNPNLDDGVMINFAPLWHLIPQHKPWQRELKATWDALREGKYDWAHLAMHLWPERVVPRCATDRSLAIAHRLEDVFWVEDEDGKWKPRENPTRPVSVLVAERSSQAVKAALKSLLEAPDPAGSTKRGRKSKPT